MIRPFKTDGCSNPIQVICNRLADLDFKDLCIVHDWLYWQGGTPEERYWADRIFYRGIQARGREKLDLLGVLARFGFKLKWYKFKNWLYMWIVSPGYFWAVRAFGWIKYYRKWSWGYGWPASYRGTETNIPLWESRTGGYTWQNQKYRLERFLLGAREGDCS